MKLGIFSWYGFELPLEKRLRQIKDAGFETTMLWWGDETGSRAPAKSGVLDLAAELGLEIENIHLPFEDANDLWSDDRAVWEGYVAKHIAAIEDCRQFGLPMIVMHIAKGREEDGPAPAGLNNMRRIVEKAEKHGVTIAIENTQKIDCLEYLLDNIRADRLGLCYDTSHGRLHEPEPFRLMKKYPERIKCLHVSDNDGAADSHWNIDRGVIDWDEFAACFPPAYNGQSLSLEVYPERGDISEKKHLAAALNALQGLRDRIEAKSR